MSKVLNNKMKLLFLFPHPAINEIEKIERGEMPSERLYGFIELRKKGWDVDICDSRFNGFSGWLLGRLKQYGFNYVDLKTIMKFRHYDAIIIKDDFSLIASLAVKFFRKKIIYFDAMFDIPKRFWKRWLVRINIKMSDAIFAYSSSQIDLWSNTFGISKTHFKLMRYTIDLSFYKAGRADIPEKPFVLAVGRDVGRDFDTLAVALEGTGIGLKLVTLPYLVHDFNRKYPWVEIYERLPYPDLFNMYAQAIIIAVPLKPGLSYPSGIRGVLESMALAKPTICTKTPVLEEFFCDGKDLVYVEPGNAIELRQKIIWLADNPKERQKLQKNAQDVVRAEFCMNRFVEMFENELMAQCAI